MAAGNFRIRDLELIVALHEAGNMTQAAKRLGISEPALSKQLQKIESWVQAPLFERGNGGMVATGSGSLFVPHAADSVQSFRRAVHEAQEAKRGQSHRLRIGVSTFHPLYLIELLRSVELRMYRNLSIELVTTFSLELIVLLQKHELDLALVTSPPSNAQITSTSVTTYPFMIVLRREHPLANRTSVTLKDVVPYPWVFFNRNVHSDLHDRILQRAREEPGHAGVLHSVSAREQAAALLTDDRILAWLTPVSAESVLHKGLKSIPLAEPDFELDVRMASLANNKSPLASEFARAFMTRLEEQRRPTQMQLPLEIKGSE